MRASPLARILLAVYVALAAYASLHPLQGWRDHGLSAFAYLGAPWPRYVTGFDVAADLLGYAPYGLLVVLSLDPRVRGARAAAVALVSGAALSMLLEAAQSYLPARIASNLDLLFTAAGAAAGAALGVRLAPWLLERGPLKRLRTVWFAPGAAADLGLALLGLWLFTQIDPTTQLFGSGDLRDLFAARGTAGLGRGCARREDRGAGDPDARRKCLRLAHAGRPGRARRRARRGVRRGGAASHRAPRRGGGADHGGDCAGQSRAAEPVSRRHIQAVAAGAFPQFQRIDAPGERGVAVRRARLPDPARLAARPRGARLESALDVVLLEARFLLLQQAHRRANLLQRQGRLEHARLRQAAREGAWPRRAGQGARQPGRVPRSLRGRPVRGGLPGRGLVQVRRPRRRRRDHRGASAARPRGRAIAHVMRASTRREFVAGPAGRIECAVDAPEGAARGFALIAHPHPLFGGTLDK